MRTESEGFLSRWSRLKKQQQEQESESHLNPVDSLDPSAADVLQSDAEQALQQVEAPPLLTDADMPSLDSLDENSDFSMFMSEGVSEELRNLALRKLFKHAVFNVTDGLDEYAEDYTSFEKLGDIVTCDMKHHIEMEARKRLAESEEQIEQRIEAIDMGVESNDEIDERQPESPWELAQASQHEYSDRNSKNINKLHEEEHHDDEDYEEF